MKKKIGVVYCQDGFPGRLFFISSDKVQKKKNGFFTYLP